MLWKAALIMLRIYSDSPGINYVIRGVVPLIKKNIIQKERSL